MINSTNLTNLNSSLRAFGAVPSDISVRWIDIGLSSPELFHASYVGLAQAQARDAEPVILWGRATAHVCLGASQSAADELEPEIAFPVCRRPLGGGTVWLDETQYCFIYIVPQAHLCSAPRTWGEWALAPALGTYHDFDLPVRRVDQDIWLHQQKIGGSGSATVNQCAVIAGSFMMHFGADSFVSCVRASCPGFRKRLASALKEGMTDWASHQTPPNEQDLKQVFQHNILRELGWYCRDGNFFPHELAAIEAAVLELREDDAEDVVRPKVRRVKINAHTYLCERYFGKQWLRVLTDRDRISSLEASLNLSPQIVCGLYDVPVEKAHLRAYLSQYLHQESASCWAEHIYDTVRMSHG